MDATVGDSLKLSEAVQRAKAIAAKIGGNFGGVPGTPSAGTEPTTMAQVPPVAPVVDTSLNSSGGLKRPLEEGNGESEPPVKSAAMENDPFGAQLAQQKMEQANTCKEDYYIPDHMVGLIIGRKGEQIQKLQDETKCNLQIDTESGPDRRRPCTLTGTQQAIDAIKAKIDGIIHQAQGIEDGGITEEILIPADKVGLIIGKGGETIRSMQSKLQVRMAMIQDGTENTGQAKPLRISGDKEKVKAAEQAVRDLINNEGTGKEIPVPKPLVGMVIGRSGDTIKNIQIDTGAKVQFKEDDPLSPNRVALISGSTQSVDRAVEIIQEILDSAKMGPGGRGRGRGRGGFRGGRGGFGGRGGYGGGYGPPRGDPVEHYVPEGKCGMVIGKGGETIKSIMDQTGAHVEVNRNEDLDPPGSKIFFIRGNPNQIEHAQQLIDEKVNSFGPPGSYSGPPGGPGMGPGGPGGYGNHGPPGGGHPPHPQPQQQQYGGPWGNNYQQPWQPQPPQPAPQQQPQPEVPKPGGMQQPWNPYYNYYQQPQPQQQPVSTPQQPAPAQQPIQQPATQMPATSTPQPAAQPAAAPGALPGQAPPPQDPNQLSAYYRQQAAQAESAAQAALSNPPQQGQTDYSQQWADYYRQLQSYYNQQAAMAMQGGAAPAPQQGYQPPAATGAPQQAYQPAATAAPQQAYQPPSTATAQPAYQPPTSVGQAYQQGAQQSYQPPAQ